MRTPKFDITAYEGPALDLENIAKASKKKSEIDAILSAAASLRTHGEFVVKLLADLEEAQAKLAAAEKDADRWQKLKAYYTAAVFDPEREDGLDLGEGVALVFLLPKGSRVSANADATIDAIAARKDPT